MPDLISRIPIGFNLDGYDFLNSSEASASPTAFSSGGIDANWEGGLVDDRWVADTSLKQIQVQVTNFQSAPLQYISEGKKYYGEIYDGVDDYSYTGTGAFTGNPTGKGCIGARLGTKDINDCQNGKLSTTLQTWSESLAQSESGRKDFYCGVAIAPKTIVDYLSHFYNLNVTGQQVVDIAKKKILCVEVLFNMTGTQGKAYRFKVVDAASGADSSGGTKGTMNHGMYYDYDVLDIMTAILLLNDFSEICTFTSKELNLVVNQGDLNFPWASAGYNYKKGQIPGYGPASLAGLGLVYESKAGTQISGSRALFKTKGLTHDRQHNIARARYFVDPENKETAKNIIPNLPDEFFQTNYSNKATAYFNTTPLTNYNSIGDLVKDYAAKIMLYGKYLKEMKKPMVWGSCKLSKNTNQGTTTNIGTTPYYIPAYRSTGGKCNCDAFVNWVLLEGGITNDVNLQSEEARNWTAAMLNGRLNPGYSAIKVPDITQAQPGDILVYDYKNGKGHCAIFDSLSGASISGYGMGNDEKCGGNTTIPGGEPSTKSLKEIIRIVKV